MRVYLSEHIHPDAAKLLKAHAEIIDDFDEIEQLDAIILRGVYVTREMMKRAARLKVIGKHGVGCNTIDLQAAQDLGIKVINTPTSNINSVAEMLVGMIFDAARRIYYANAKIRGGEVRSIAPVDMTGMEISGKTLGLIGIGNVSRRLAEIIRGGFGMSVVGYDPYVTLERAKEAGIHKVETIEETIRLSDVINVSVPLTTGTRDLISGKVFDCFKPTAILVNASRGGIVNEDDLYDALAGKKLFGAACDVFLDEPPPKDNKLLTLETFCATPHIAGNTEECLYRTGMEIVSETLKVLNGGQPAHPVFPS